MNNEIEQPILSFMTKNVNQYYQSQLEQNSPLFIENTPIILLNLKYQKEREVESIDIQQMKFMKIQPTIIQSLGLVQRMAESLIQQSISAILQFRSVDINYFQLINFLNYRHLDFQSELALQLMGNHEMNDKFVLAYLYKQLSHSKTKDPLGEIYKIYPNNWIQTWHSVKDAEDLICHAFQVYLTMKHELVRAMKFYSKNKVKFGKIDRESVISLMKVVYGSQLIELKQDYFELNEAVQIIFSATCTKKPQFDSLLENVEKRFQAVRDVKGNEEINNCSRQCVELLEKMKRSSKQFDQMYFCYLVLCIDIGVLHLYKETNQ